MQRMIFVNLPVVDVAASTRFYEAVGFEKNAQFSDDKSSSMVWSEVITFQLLQREYFRTFTTKPVAVAHESCQALLCLSRESKAAVDGMIDAAKHAGGRVDPRKPIDLGFLYNRTFEDLDGHVFELVWMNPDAMPATAGSN